MTLADVAARAGVSVATASVAITGRPSGNCRVSPAVAQKIRDIARQLNYRPNLQARNLSTQRTRTVAVLIKRAAWNHALHYVSAAQRVLRARGYSESFLLHPDDNAESEREHLELCVERGVEGILAMPLVDPLGRANVDLYNRLIREEGIPIVQLGMTLPDCIAPSVTVDVPGGIAKLVTLLHAMGHRHIGMTTLPGYDVEPFNPLHPQRYAHRCYRGYRQAMGALKLDEQVFVATGELPDTPTQFDRTLPLAAEIARAKPRPTAVIGFSDFAAAALLAGLAEQGLRVPHDISVVAGVDEPFVRMLRPALTALAPPFDQVGQTAAEMLLRMIDGAEAAHVQLPSALNMRESLRGMER